MVHSTVLEAKVIPWELSEDSWAVAIKHASGRQALYLVGTRAEAEEEVKTFCSHKNL